MARLVKTAGTQEEAQRTAIVLAQHEGVLAVYIAGRVYGAALCRRHLDIAVSADDAGCT